MDTELIKRKNRCISCVYLCWHHGDRLYDAPEVAGSIRSEILSKTFDRQTGSIHPRQFRCYKGLVPPEEVDSNVETATCPSRGWRLHTDGKTPQMSLQQEQHGKALRWTIVGVVISLIVLIATVVLGTCNLLINLNR